MIAGHAWEIFIVLIGAAFTTALTIMAKIFTTSREEDRERSRRFGERLGELEKRQDQHEGWHMGVRDEKRRKFNGDNEE